MLTRRQMMTSVLVAASGGALGARLWLGWSNRRRRERREAELVALAGSLPESVVALGSACAAAAVDGSRPDVRATLARDLVAEIEQAAPSGARDEPTARLLEESVRTDFATGKTVVVDDWLLSRTEARLYLLRAPTPAELSASLPAGGPGRTSGSARRRKRIRGSAR